MKWHKLYNYVKVLLFKWHDPAGEDGKDSSSIEILLFCCFFLNWLCAICLVPELMVTLAVTHPKT
jgi:hypothetical protein